MAIGTIPPRKSHVESQPSPNSCKEKSQELVRDLPRAFGEDDLAELGSDHETKERVKKTARGKIPLWPDKI